jgi:F0F1-type ATP synthase assembly protein I
MWSGDPYGAGGANEALQETLDRNCTNIIASYALIGAVLVLGALGYVVDRWAGTSPWCLLIGLLIGIGAGFGNLVRALRAR